VLLSPRAPDGKDVLSADEISFHAAVILASGGMTLSSDDYPGLTAEQKGMLRRMLPPTNVAARFVGDRFEEGWADLGDGRRLVFVFNWDDVPRDHLLSFGGRRRVTDFWTDASVGSVARHLVCRMPARSARVYVVRNT
jgi:alpha-galactosidase